MSPGVTIVLIIVVWLFVLAPILLRGQRPIRRSGEAYDETRVLFEGDSGAVPVAPRPKVSAEDVHRHDDAADLELAAAVPVTSGHDGYADVDDDYELITEDGDPAEAARSGNAKTSNGADIVDGELVAEGEEADAADGHAAADADDATAAGAQEAQVSTGVSTGEGQDTDDTTPHDVKNQGQRARGAEFEAMAPRLAPAADAYALDETFTSPVDLMYPGVSDRESDLAGQADGSGVAADAEAPHDAEAQGSEAQDDAARSTAVSAMSESNDLTEDEIAFAEKRRGRGGWDPVADQRNSADRYQRRQRTLIGLAVADVLFAALGIILGGWMWAVVAVAAVITVAYLVALRTQVRQEQQLRARRIYQLRRARLGVRNAQDEELAIPRKLRRPGAVVVETDDESVDFHHLPVTYLDAEDDHEEFGIVNRRQLRDELSERRVS